jgi:hypothetical protein
MAKSRPVENEYDGGGLLFAAGVLFTIGILDIADGRWWTALLGLGFLAVYLVGLVRARRWQQRQSRIDQGCCPQCGYDLRASRTRCPECGKLIPYSIPTRRNAHESADP